MLASRGPVYKSRESAGGGGRGFHDHCDCRAVLVRKGHDWEGREAFELYEDLWGEATKGYNGHAAELALRRELDRAGREGWTHQELLDHLREENGSKRTADGDRRTTGRTSTRAAKPASQSDEEFAANQVRVLEASLSKLEADGQGDSNKAKWQREQLAKYRAQAGAASPGDSGGAMAQSDTTSTPPPTASGDDGGNGQGPGGRTGFGDPGDDGFKATVDHAWERHAPQEPGEPIREGSKFRAGTTREDVSDLVAEITRRDRVIPPVGDVDPALRARLDAGEVTLAEERYGGQYVNLFAQVGGARYEVRLAGKDSTAHPIDGDGIVRHNEKGEEVDMPLGKRPVSGWNRPRTR